MGLEEITAGDNQLDKTVIYQGKRLTGFNGNPYFLGFLYEYKSLAIRKATRLI